VTDAQFEKITALLTAQLYALETISNAVTATALAQGGYPAGASWDLMKPLVDNARKLAATL
jgi:hypothetical protein